MWSTGRQLRCAPLAPITTGVKFSLNPQKRKVYEKLVSESEKAAEDFCLFARPRRPMGFRFTNGIACAPGCSLYPVGFANFSSAW